MPLPSAAVPPQMIMLVPVHTAAGQYLSEGAPRALIAFQVFVAGSKTPPVESAEPPHTIILEPVHTAAWPDRGPGAPLVATTVQVLDVGSHWVDTRVTHVLANRGTDAGVLVEVELR